MAIVVQRHPYVGGLGLATLLLGLIAAASIAVYSWADSDGETSVTTTAPPVAPPAAPAAIEVPAAPVTAIEPLTIYVFDDPAAAAEFEFLTATLHEPGMRAAPYEVAVFDGPNAGLALAELVRFSGSAQMDGVPFTVVDLR